MKIRVLVVKLEFSCRLIQMNLSGVGDIFLHSCIPYLQSTVPGTILVSYGAGGFVCSVCIYFLIRTFFNCSFRSTLFSTY